MVRALLEEFHASHPNIRVFYTPDPPRVEDTLADDLAAGRAPDVFAGCCSFFPILAQQGHTLDLRPFSSDLDLATIDDWDPAQYRALFTHDGRQYALPKYHGALALYYNKDLFDARGVTYPDAGWDHDDYLTAMRQLTQRGGAAGRIWGSMLDVTWERLQVHVNGWGGHFVDPNDPSRLMMCEAEAMAALQWIHDRMWQDRVMASFVDVQNMTTRQAFVGGHLAMVEDGSWALRDILDGADFRIGVAPFPAGPKRRVTLATTDGFGIYAGTRHPEAAWELVKFLVSKTAGRALAQAHFLQPARASLLQDWIGFVRAEYPDATADLDLMAFADGHLNGYSVTAEAHANMATTRRLAYEIWDQVFTLGQWPVTQVETLCARIEGMRDAASG